jgi:hypothetical protein
MGPVAINEEAIVAAAIEAAIMVFLCTRVSSK